MSQYILTPLEIMIGNLLKRGLPDTYEVLAEDQRGPRQPEPFATFKIISDTSLTSMPAHAHVTGSRHIIQDARRVQCSVNVYGPEAYQDLAQCVLKIRAAHLVERKDLALRDVGPLQRLAGDGLTDRFHHTQTDLIFGYILTTELTLDPIERYKGTGLDTTIEGDL